MYEWWWFLWELIICCNYHYDVLKSSSGCGQTHSIRNHDCTAHIMMLHRLIRYWTSHIFPWFFLSLHWLNWFTSKCLFLLQYLNRIAVAFYRRACEWIRVYIECTQFHRSKEYNMLGFFFSPHCYLIFYNEFVTFCSIDKSIDFKNGYKQHFFAILQTFFYHFGILSANTKNIVSKDNAYWRMYLQCTSKVCVYCCTVCTCTLWSLWQEIVCALFLLLLFILDLIFINKLTDKL